MKVSEAGGENCQKLHGFRTASFAWKPHVFIPSTYIHVYLSTYTCNAYTHFLSNENIACRLLLPDVLFSVSFRHICISAGRGAESSSVVE